MRRNIVLLMFILLFLFLTAGSAQKDIEKFFSIVKLGNVNGVRLMVVSERSLLNVKNKNGRNPLHVALAENQKETALFLLNSGADIHSADYNGFTPLHAAVQTGNTEIVKMLLDRGSNVNVRSRYGITPLQSAIFKNDPKSVSLLISEGADVNTPGLFDEPVLKSAAVENRISIADILLENGAKTKYRFKGSSNTLLHHAASNGYLGIVRGLLENGADPNAKNDKGQTPLHILVSGCSGMSNVNQLLIAKLLLKHGANINAKFREGGKTYTPLSYMSRDNCPSLYNFLYRKGADRT